MDNNHKLKKQNKKKKKRFYFKNNNINNNRVQLGDGFKGFLVTCNQKEYYCLKESYNILNEIYDRLYSGNDCGNDDRKKPDPDDIDACIEAELLAEQKNNRHFLQINTNCKNLLFIRIQNNNNDGDNDNNNDNQREIDPQSISKQLWLDLHQNHRQNCRYIQRLIPVIQTCRIDKLQQKLTDIFKSDSSIVPKNVCSYQVNCRIRNYSSTTITEKSLQKMVIEIVQEQRPNWYANLTDPDKFIQINVLSKACCISILDDYRRNCKYNLIEFIRKNFGDDNFDKNNTDSINDNDDRENSLNEIKVERSHIDEIPNDEDVKSSEPAESNHMHQESLTIESNQEEKIEQNDQRQSKCD